MTTGCDFLTDENVDDQAICAALKRGGGVLLPLEAIWDGSDLLVALPRKESHRVAVARHDVSGDFKCHLSVDVDEDIVVDWKLFAEALAMEIGGAIVADFSHEVFDKFELYGTDEVWRPVCIDFSREHEGIINCM